jgi:hypothetical protein
MSGRCDSGVGEGMKRCYAFSDALVSVVRETMQPAHVSL